MNELKDIWRRNTICQNISWIGNIIVFLVIMPYAIVKELMFPGELE